MAVVLMIESVVSQGFEVDDVSSPAEDQVPAAGEDEAPPPANEEVPAVTDEELSPPAEDEVPAAADEEVPSPVDEDVPAATDVELPAVTDEELPAATDEELPAATDEELPAATDEEASPPAEDEVLPPAEDEASSDSAGGGGGGVGSAAVDLDSALGSLTAFLDTREQLSNPELELMGIETFALSPIESSPGLKGVLLEILGPYDNIVTQYKYQQSNNSYYTYVNEVTPDYPWICSAVLFILLLVSVFRFIGRCFSWMK